MLFVVDAKDGRIQDTFNDGFGKHKGVFENHLT